MKRGSPVRSVMDLHSAQTETREAEMKRQHARVGVSPITLLKESKAVTTPGRDWQWMHVANPRFAAVTKELISTS